MNDSKKIFNTLVVTVLSLWLLIDMVNGYLMLNNISLVGGISFGEMSRILFFGILLLTVRLKDKDLLLLFVPYTLLVLCFIQYLIFGTNIVRSIGITVKLSLPVLLFLYFKNNEYLRSNPRFLNGIIYINAAVLLVNLYISYFGVGYKNYANVMGLGGSGYFYAGNEVSGLLLIIYGLLLFKFRDEIRKVIFATLLFFVASLVLTSKAAIFGLLIIFGLYLVIYEKLNRYHVTALALLLGFFIYKFLFSYISFAFNRWYYFMKEQGAFIAFTGGADRWGEIISILLKFRENPFLLLMGQGWTGAAEQNFFDLLEGFGVLGLLLYVIWIYWGVYVYNKMDQFNHGLFALLVLYLILGVATLAGHTMQSAMIAPFIAILANLDILKNGKRINTN